MIGTRNGQAKGLGLLAVVVALAACEPAVERPVARRQASITAGSPAPADGAVVAIVQRRVSCAEATTVVLCSGTLIAPRAVVTAAHCVADGPARRLEVRTTGAAGGVVEVRSIVEAHVHPSWNGADRAHDLAVVWLDRPSTATPIELPPPDAAALAIGDEVRLVGFGAQEAGASSGDRRQGTARVRAIDAATFEVDAAPSLTCQGDSGGPALRRLGEREVIAGVTSDGDAACARFSAFARVDVDVERFLAPILAAGPKEPTRALPLDALCTTACASDHDCPSALWCAAASSQGARCVGPGGVHARYGVECDDDGDCIAGTCAPVVEGERETCRCREICPRSDAGPSLSGGGGGCAHSAAARSGATSLLLIGALAALRARSFTSRRRLRRAPRR